MFRLIYRGLLVLGAFYLFALGFIPSVAHETGSSSFFPMIIPIVGAIAINLFLPKLGKENLVLPLGVGTLLIGAIFFEYGGFVNYTAIGLSAFIIFFHGLRPWNS
jgi:uncharacterized membrane protein YhhN